MTSLTLEQRELLREALQEAGNRLVQLSQTSHGAIFDKVDAALALLDSLPQTDPAYPVPVSGEARTTDVWEPIETAPCSPYKPYPEVLVLFDGKHHAVAHYSNVMGGWVSMYGHTLNEPTHWMPLPKPPQETK